MVFQETAGKRAFRLCNEWGYRSPYVNITTTVGHDTQNNNQKVIWCVGSGGRTPYGVTLSNDLSDTFAIIHAEGAQGLSSIMPLVVVWIFWGNGVVPYVTPYEKNQISIDPPI